MNEPKRYIVVSNGQIHDASDSESLAQYSAEALHEMTGQEVTTYTRSTTIFAKEEK